MKFKRTTVFLLVLMLLCITTAQLKAQGTPCGDPDVDCPIDTPVLLLVSAVLLLSVKKIIADRNSQKQAVKEA